MSGSGGQGWRRTRGRRGDVVRNGSTGWRRRTAVVALVAAAGPGALVGCGFPLDPDGTLDRVRGGALVVGVSENPPWTLWPDGSPGVGEEGEPGGIEVELVTDFAASLDADVVWVAGSEATLMTQLEEGELDVVVAGLESTSPWSSHAALTAVYAVTTDDAGAPVRHVMAARLGENDLLTTLEGHLLQQEVQP